MGIMRGLIILVLIGTTLGARKLKSSKPREEKSLLNTFPFNANSGGDHHHHNERQPSVQLPAVNANQGRRGSGNRRPSDSGTGLDGVSFGDVASANPGRDGKRCIDKVEMIEETEYDEVVQCDHSYNRRRIVRRTSGRTVSSTMRRLPSMRLLRFAEPPWSRTVMCRDLRSVELSMNLSAGPSRRSMMLKMM